MPLFHAAVRLGIGFRPMTDADMDFVAALYASTRAEELALTGWPAEQQQAFLAQQHQAQHRHYRAYYPDAEWLIVERGGEPIGRLYLDEWPDQYRIVDIALVPAARGGGVGGAILRDLLDAARARGKGASIHVEKANPARRLYQRLGFEVVEDKGVYDLMEWGLDRGAG